MQSLVAIVTRHLLLAYHVEAEPEGRRRVGI